MVAALLRSKESLILKTSMRMVNRNLARDMIYLLDICQQSLQNAKRITGNFLALHWKIVFSQNIDRL